MIYLFINTELLQAYHVPGPGPGAGDYLVMKAATCPHGDGNLEETNDKKQNKHIYVCVYKIINCGKG